MTVSDGGRCSISATSSHSRRPKIVTCLLSSLSPFLDNRQLSLFSNSSQTDDLSFKALVQSVLTLSSWHRKPTGFFGPLSDTMNSLDGLEGEHLRPIYTSDHKSATSHCDTISKMKSQLEIAKAFTLGEQFQNRLAKLVTYNYS